VGVFSFQAELPAGVVLGAARDDLGAGCFAGGVPDVGQSIKVELQLDPAALTFAPGSEPTPWVIVTGRIHRVVPCSDPELGSDAMIVVDAAVTTETVPCELAGRFKLLLEREDDVWRVKRMVAP